MPKKMEFYEGEEQQKRVKAVMAALISPSSKKPKQVAKADPKAIGKNLNRS